MAVVRTYKYNHDVTVTYKMHHYDPAHNPVYLPYVTATKDGRAWDPVLQKYNHFKAGEEKIAEGQVYNLCKARSLTHNLDGSIEFSKTGPEYYKDFDLLNYKEIGFDKSNQPVYELKFVDHNYHDGDITGSKFIDAASFVGGVLGGGVIMAGLGFLSLVTLGLPTAMMVGFVSMSSIMAGSAYVRSNYFGKSYVENISSDDVAPINQKNDSDTHIEKIENKLMVDEVKPIKDISHDNVDIYMKDLISAQAKLITHLTEHASSDVITIDHLEVANAKLAVDVAAHATPDQIEADHHAILQYTEAVNEISSSHEISDLGMTASGDSNHAAHDQLFRR